MSEIQGRMPAAVAAVLGGRAGEREDLGKSGVQVILFDDYVLKVRPENDRDTMDVRILESLSGKAPVPQVAAHEVKDGLDWLVMTRLRGEELCHPR